MRTRINKKKKNPRRIFLVVCEGETESVYVELLRRHYRLPIVIKSRIAGNRINARLVGQYIRELGVSTDSDYRIFYVYDMDVENIVRILQNMEGTPVLSNPCVEFWFLLHSLTHNKTVKSEEVVRILTKSALEWKSYRKGCLTDAQRGLLVSKTAEAVERARQLLFPQNPSSNMPVLIEALEREKIS